jgi:UDP-galactopyranose mutase
MTKRLKTISIPIDFEAEDAGYSVLKSKRMVHFLLDSVRQGNNLIQTVRPFTLHKTTLYLRSKPYKGWNSPAWEDIQCEAPSSWLKKTPCKIGKNNKLFAKYKSNETVAGFAIYLWNIVSGEITEAMHKEWVKQLKSIVKKEVVIHNEDVDWFHVKELV